MKSMLSAILISAAMAGCLVIPVFGQDQGGQMMQKESKTGDTMMKMNDQKMMKGHTKTRRMSKKKKSHTKSMKANTMKSGAANPM